MLDIALFCSIFGCTCNEVIIILVGCVGFTSVSVLLLLLLLLILLYSTNM